jgi:tetratricopeptide (TPR) repeat protein
MVVSACVTAFHAEMTVCVSLLVIFISITRFQRLLTLPPIPQLRLLCRCETSSGAHIWADPITDGARGLVYVYSGEPLKGISYIEQAMRLDPAQQQYRHFLGTAYLVAGNYETAAAIFKERVAITPTTDLSRALLASALGRFC